MTTYKIRIRFYVAYTISILVAFLLVYAAVSKILEFGNFQAQLGQSPLISAYTGFISYAVLISEFTIALLLVVSRTRVIALHCASVLMLLFTAYIVAILNFSSDIPCSCGGILERMGWTEHLVFNIAVTIAIFIAILVIATRPLRATFALLLETMFAAALMTVLFISSEHLMHRENPFIRRFVSGSAIRKAEISLPNGAYYFAGAGENAIYLSNLLAPQNIIVYDTLLKTKRQFSISLDNEQLKFHAIQVKVAPPYFYVMDGTLPVILKGKISDWIAKTIMKDEGYYFSRAAIIDSNRIAFRTQLESNGEHALGLFSFRDSLSSKLETRLLQKQIDGFFDTDGTMRYDENTKTYVYTYYYRNQFIVADDRLQLRYRGRTIDTTKTAKLKVVDIRERGQHKLASPAQVINKVTALSDNHLFVYSTLIGRYESPEMWDITCSVDVYNVANNEYLSSIYIYNTGQSRISDMIAFGDNLYVITGTGLQRYKLGKNLKQNNQK